MLYRHATTRVVVSHCLYFIRYIVLSLSQAIYAYFIEGDTIFVGKRKTFDKRVSVAGACVL
jgi:hypothetical protein